MSARRTKSQAPDVSGPHRFVDPPDPRLGFALSAGRNYPGSNIASALVAVDSLYPALCAWPGCGKKRNDPIHWPSEPEADRNLGEFPPDS
jgi:hypothetical protein